PSGDGPCEATGGRDPGRSRPGRCPRPEALRWCSRLTGPHHQGHHQGDQANDQQPKDDMGRRVQQHPQNPDNERQAQQRTANFREHGNTFPRKGWNRPEKQKPSGGVR
ncbi:MAG TPA: hypothetical protein VJR27_00840, partial [Candidatus Saccharimonadales bacterium]|nr:hypothetical protein [Candidatus Saccharimonadales bacterium]